MAVQVSLRQGADELFGDRHFRQHPLDLTPTGAGAQFPLRSGA
jgi:hypothetical protein